MIFNVIQKSIGLDGNKDPVEVKKIMDFKCDITAKQA